MGKLKDIIHSFLEEAEDKQDFKTVDGHYYRGKIIKIDEQYLEIRDTESKETRIHQVPLESLDLTSFGYYVPILDQWHLVQWDEQTQEWEFVGWDFDFDMGWDFDFDKT